MVVTMAIDSTRLIPKQEAPFILGNHDLATKIAKDTLLLDKP